MNECMSVPVCMNIYIYTYIYIYMYTCNAVRILSYLDTYESLMVGLVLP